MPRPPTARPCDAAVLTRDTRGLSVSSRCLQGPRADAAPSLRDCGPFLLPPPTSPLPRGQRKKKHSLTSEQNDSLHCLQNNVAVVSSHSWHCLAIPRSWPPQLSDVSPLVRCVTARFFDSKRPTRCESPLVVIENPVTDNKLDKKIRPNRDDENGTRSG